MTAKDYLLQIKRAEKLIELKKFEIEKLKSQLGYKAVNYENERVQSSPVDRTDILCKLLDFERELYEQIAELTEIKSKIIKLIDTIDDTDLIELLYLRYIDCMQWEEIAIKMSYSNRWVLKKHRQALLKVEKKLQEDTQLHIIS